MSHENELLRKIMQGESEALEELLSIYYPQLFRYCLWHCPNRETAEDAVQETVLKIVKYMGRYKHKGQFRSFAYKIAQNTCIDLARKRSVDIVPIDTIEQEIPYFENSFAVVEADVEILRLTAKLPADLKEVILLRFAQDLTIREIAEVTDVPLRTAQSRLNRAIKQIRKELADNEEQV